MLVDSTSDNKPHMCFFLQTMEVGVEQEQLQQEAELDVKINEEEVTTQTHSSVEFWKLVFSRSK